MASKEIHTVIERYRGVRREFSGTVADLRKRFQGTLKAGRFHDRKVKTNPRNVEALVESLNLASARLNNSGEYRVAVM